MKKYLKCCLVLALGGWAAMAAPLGDGSANEQDRLASLPMLTAVDFVTVSSVAVLDAGGTRLAGLVLNLPSLEGDAWKAVAELPRDLLKVLERAETPVPVAAASSSVTLGGWAVPKLTLLAFGAGTLLLAAGAVFGGALLRLSLTEARKHKRMRRRYVP